MQTLPDFLGGFNQQAGINQAADTAHIQQAGALQGILKEAQGQERAHAFRTEIAQLGPNATAEQITQVASKYADPKELLAHGDRVTGQANVKEMALARLQQAAAQGAQTFALRAQGAKTAQEQKQIENDYKAFQASVARERLKYDTGATVAPFAPLSYSGVPAAPPNAVTPPPGTPAPLSGQAPDQAAAVAAINANRAAGGPGGTLEIPSGSPQAPVAASAAPAAADPWAMKPAPVAAPSAPAGPAVQPVAAPQPVVAPAPSAGPVMPANIAALPKKAQDAWTLAQTKTSTVGQLGPEELGPMAWEKLLFGTNPPGMGNASAAQRQQVNAERARLGRSLGLSDMEMAMLPQDNKVKMKAVDTLTKWGATVGRSAEKLDLDLGVALDYAKRLPLQQLQFINKAIVAGTKEFNSPDANAYATAINSVRQEYARLMSGPTSNAMLPVEAMKKGNELLSSGVDVASLEEVGKQMRRDAANTMTATQNGIGALRGSITSLGRQNAFERTPAGAIPEFATEADAAKAGLPAGTKVKIGGRPGTWQ